jgi:hypothetical protein
MSRNLAQRLVIRPTPMGGAPFTPGGPFPRGGQFRASPLNPKYGASGGLGRSPRNHPYSFQSKAPRSLTRERGVGGVRVDLSEAPYLT